MILEINANKVHPVFNGLIKELQRNASCSTNVLQAHLLLDSYQVQNVAKKSLEQNIVLNAMWKTFKKGNWKDLEWPCKRKASRPMDGIYLDGKCKNIPHVSFF